MITIKILKFPLRLICLFKGHKFHWQDKGGFFGFFESKYDYRCVICSKESTKEKIEKSGKYKNV